MIKANKKRKKTVILITLNTIMILGIFWIILFYGPIFYHEIRYAFMQIFDERSRNAPKFEDLLAKRRVEDIPEVKAYPIHNVDNPKNRDFGLVIPKIGVNDIVFVVNDINNDAESEEAMKKGIAWARGSAVPGDYGNAFFFSHSTRNVQDMWRYNAQFTLLSKLERGDLFTVFYQGRQYDYFVDSIRIIEADDRSYFNVDEDGRFATLQTCYPPGFDTHRLVVRGRLVAFSTK